MVIRGGAVAVSFVAFLALLDQIKLVGVCAFVGNRWHEPAAG